jgi:hypothetical protein
MMDAVYPGFSYVFAVLYLTMLKFCLETKEWLVSVIAMAILVGAATVAPIGAYGVVFGMINECATQVSHDLYEKAYFTEYENKKWPDFMHCVLEHDFFLLPLCMAACQRQIMPSATVKSSTM